MHLGPELQRVRTIRSVTATRTATAATTTTAATATATATTEPSSPEATPTTTPLAPDDASHEPDPDLGPRLHTEPHPIVVVSRQGNLELVDDRRAAAADRHIEPTADRQRQTASTQLARADQLDRAQPTEG